MRLRTVEAMTKKASRWSRRAKIVSAVCGCVLVAAGAYAATNWVVGLNAGSSGEGQSATIANLSITAVATPAPGNVLFPGATGDVVVTIANPNSYPVNITAVNLPASTIQAGGFSNSALDHGPDRVQHDDEWRHLELRHDDQRHLAHPAGRRSRWVRAGRRTTRSWSR